MPKISNDLINAYKGVYEDELARSTIKDHDAWIIETIQKDSPKQRLDVYLQWNGILGWTNRIWEISQGEL